MSTAVILDVETTGIDDPQVIELAYMGPLSSPLAAASTTLINFKPTKPISLGALATHDIIEADLAEFPEWRPGQFCIPGGTAYFIGHNIDFDWKAIGSPSVKRICTLALARHVWPSLDSHKLAALIYHLYPHGLARDMVKGAHNAAADVGLCKVALEALWDAVGRPDWWEKLWQASEKARIPKVFTFGKHQGRPVAEIKRTDPSYISWCLAKCDIVTGDPY